MADRVECFSYMGSRVRTVNVDGSPWFVSADICRYFGVTNRNRALQKLPPEDKGGTQIQTNGGVQTVQIINESGLYTLLFSLEPSKARGMSVEYVEARCQELKAFRRWVTHEVLPSIRKTGRYLITPSAFLAQANQLAKEILGEIECAKLSVDTTSTASSE